MRMTVIVAGTAVLALVFVGWLVARQWAELGSDVSPMGWIAYAAGGVLSFAVSAGLFFALFYSARSGHDDIDRGDGDAF